MIDGSINKVGWFVALMIVSNSTTVLPFSWGIGYYIILALTLLFILYGVRTRVEISMLLLFAVCAFSIIGNNIPAYFSSWPRLGTFVMLASIFSYFLRSKKAVAFRTRLFISISKLLVLVTFVCTIFLALGLGYGYKNSSYFQGITVHSMIMGPVAAMTILYCAYQLQYRHKRRLKLLYFLLIIGSGLCLLQAGSRAALIGALVSVIAFMYYLNKKNFFTLVKKYIWVILIIAASSPFWLTYTDKIEEKNGGLTELSTDSRAVHWAQRVIEWKSSPIIGIGFGTVDIDTKKGSAFSEQTGAVETGSSWLCVLSMTGVLGFICVLIIIINAYRKALALMNVSRPTGSYLIAILIFFIFHMMAEGYIFAGGNFLNTQFWLLIGVIYGISSYPEFAHVLEKRLQLRRPR